MTNLWMIESGFTWGPDAAMEPGWQGLWRTVKHAFATPGDSSEPLLRLLAYHIDWYQERVYFLGGGNEIQAITTYERLAVLDEEDEEYEKYNGELVPEEDRLSMRRLQDGELFGTPLQRLRAWSRTPDKPSNPDDLVRELAETIRFRTRGQSKYAELFNAVDGFLQRSP